MNFLFHLLCMLKGCICHLTCIVLKRIYMAMSFSIKSNFPIPIIRSFHLCRKTLRILKYSITFNVINSCFLYFLHGLNDMNTTFTPATYVCLSQVRTWNANVIWFGSFLCSMILMWDVIVDICRIDYHHCLYFLIRVMHHCLIRVTQGIYNENNNMREWLPKTVC